jgi:IS5 family transposase
MDNYTWEYIQKHPQETKRLLGIDHDQLRQLIEQGKILHQRKQEEIEKKKIRIIKAGGGNHTKLSEEEQIILMLVYLRHHLSFQLLGLLFQVSESSAHKFFDYWQKLFQDELPPSLLEQVKKCQEEMEKIREELTNHELIVDSAEQVIERPSNYEVQKKYYSGKQKRHTFKSQFVVLPKGADIVDVVVGKPGPMSDIRICRQTLNKFDSQQAFSGDKAYVGESQITTPQKKPKNGQLTEEQKEENKILSSKRIFVEHLIRVVKIFKIIQERFRLHKSRYDSIILTVCGLVRLRIGSLILEIIESAETGQVIEVVMSHNFSAKLDFDT